MFVASANIDDTCQFVKSSVLHTLLPTPGPPAVSRAFRSRDKAVCADGIEAAGGPGMTAGGQVELIETRVEKWDLE